MRFTLVQTVAPSAAPVELAEARNYLRLTERDHDAVLQLLLDTAIGRVESFLRRALVNRTYTMLLREMPSGMALALPMPPLVSVSQVVSYNEAHAASVFASSNYRVDTASLIGRLVLNEGATWPTGVRADQPLEVTFVAGYGSDGASVPAAIRHGLLMTVATWFELRGEASTTETGLVTYELPTIVQGLLGPWRCPRC